MKKFYTVLLATAVALGASARYQQAEMTGMTKPANVTRIVRNLPAVAAKAPALKAPTAGATLADYAGSYTLDCYWLLVSSTAPSTLELTVVDATTGEVEIAGFPPEFTIKGTLDLTAGTLTIPNNQYVGTDSYGDKNWFYLKSLDASGSQIQPGATSAKASVGVIDGEVVTFPAEDIWAIGDPNNEDLGWWYMSMENVLYYGTPDPNLGWEDWGEATFQDGWVLPAFGIDQTDSKNWYKVAMQKSTQYDGVYRLVNPYGGECPVADKNELTTGGYISFDITDHDHVYFGVDAAGFGNASVDLPNIYCYNTLTMAALYFGYSPMDIVEIMGNDIPYSTFDAKNKVLTVSCPIENGAYEPDACFGVPGEEDAGFCWTDENEKPRNMEVKIFFDPENAGVVDVISQKEGPKEFFNLQGVRVTNPSNGLYIVRQGSKTTKEYIR